MTALPTELWLIIFDIVVEAGIVRLEQCDYTTFAYIQTFLSSTKYRYRFHGSYFRLRLVCRRFNAILASTLTDYFSHSSVFPFPTSTRTLYLNFKAIRRTDFRRFLAGPSACWRLICLEVTCDIIANSDRLDLSELLRVDEGGVFHSVRRLALRLVNQSSEQWKYAFWTRLNRAFPRLVTLVITVEHQRASLFLLERAGEVATLENVEILYLGGTIIYSGCYFPRLRHASIAKGGHFARAQLEVLGISPHLESLLVYTTGPMINLDARLFPCLKLLGVMDHRLTQVVPLNSNHVLEHLWIFWGGFTGSGGIYGVQEKLPGISRITVDLSLMTAERRRQRTKEFRRMNLTSIGLSIRRPTYDNPIIEIERATSAKDGILNKVWGMMRR
jgi:hypothetical protein